MSNKKITIKKSVMDKIHKNEIKMKPKIYFIIGSLMLFISLVASIVVSVFLFSLIKFFLRSHGPMASIRFEQLISSFPIWLPLLIVIVLFIGIKLLSLYDFSYKKNFLFIIISFILSIFVVGYLLDYFGFNDIWFKFGPTKGLMRQYLQKNNMTPPQRGRQFRNK